MESKISMYSLYLTRKENELLQLGIENLITRQSASGELFKNGMKAEKLMEMHRTLKSPLILSVTEYDIEILIEALNSLRLSIISEDYAENLLTVLMSLTKRYHDLAEQYNSQS